jgi:hypothetical protein
VKPTIGRIVIYRSRTGDYDVPAIVTATVDTLNPKGVELGHVPALTDDTHVHLTVLTPGTPGMRRDAADFKEESRYPRSENVAGCYQEWDIAPAAPVEGKGFIESQATPAGEPGPGTWRWPERVS